MISFLIFFLLILNEFPFIDIHYKSSTLHFHGDG